MIAPTAYLGCIFFMRSSNSTAVPSTMTKSVRQQSAVNIEMRISCRLLSNGPRYSDGICFIASSSEAET